MDKIERVLEIIDRKGYIKLKHFQRIFYYELNTNYYQYKMMIKRLEDKGIIKEFRYLSGYYRLSLIEEYNIKGQENIFIRIDEDSIKKYKQLESDFVRKAKLNMYKEMRHLFEQSKDKGYIEKSTITTTLKNAMPSGYSNLVNVNELSDIHGLIEVKVADNKEFWKELGYTHSSKKLMLHEWFYYEKYLRIN